MKTTPRFSLRLALLAGLVLSGFDLANAHDCKTRQLTLLVGEVRPDVYVTEADHHLEPTSYTVLPPDASVVKVAPMAINSLNLYLTFEGIGVGTNTVVSNWSYEPTFATGSCSVMIIVNPPPIASSSGNNRSSGRHGDPVDTFTGELVLEEPADLALPGPMSLVFKRYYASGLRRGFVYSRMGANWRHNFDWSIHFIGNVLVVVDDKGRVTRYLKPDIQAGDWVQQDNHDFPREVIQETLENETHFHLYDPEALRVYKFSVPTDDQAFRLVEISNTRGGRLFLSYYDNGDLEEVSDQLGRALTFNYDPTDNPAERRLRSVSDGARTVQFFFDGELLIETRNPAGDATAYAYDEEHADVGLLTRRTLPEGNTPYTFTWNDVGKVATQTDAEGNSTSFAYDGLATTMTDPRGNASVHVHNEQGALIESTDAQGQTRSIAPDDEGRRSAVTLPSGATQTVEYRPGGGEISSATNGEGRTIQYTHTTRVIPPGFTTRDLARIDYPDGKFEAFTYDGMGNLLSMTDRSGADYIRTYNERGQLLTETTPLGGTYANAYNDDGTRSSFTDPAGNMTLLRYDEFKRPTQTDRPDGTSRALNYDHANRVLSVTDEDNNTTMHAYDKNGRRISIVDPAGNETRYQYDANGRLVHRVDGAGGEAEYRYNSLGLVEEVQYGNGERFQYGWDDAENLASLSLPDGSSVDFETDMDGFLNGVSGETGQGARVERDANGNVVKRISPSGDETVYERDVLGRIVSRTLPNGERERYAYGPHDYIASITQETLGLVTQFEHNALGLVTRAVDPNGNVWRWDYDDMGRPAATEDPLGNRTVFTHDSRNRIRSVEYPGNLGALTIDYNGVGRAVRRQYSDGVEINYEYDSLGRLTALDDVSLEYDAEGRIIGINSFSFARSTQYGRMETLTLAPDLTIAYAYDEAGRLVEVGDSDGGFVRYEYDESGWPAALFRSNGTETHIEYEPSGRVSSIEHAPFGQMSISRNAVGQPVAMSLDFPELPDYASPATNHQFDGNLQVAGFDYDVLGRLVEDDRRSYEWDLATRLTLVNEGGESAEFSYNGFGHILSQTRGGTVVEYVWNYGFPLPAAGIIREQGEPAWFLVHHPSGRLLYRISASTGERQFYHFDDRGNTQLISDDNGDRLVTYQYSPFGAVASSDTEFQNPFTFVGEYGVMQMSDSGLFVMGRRFYDNATGRFLSREAMGPHLNPLTFNPYQYAANNPMLHFDPLGADTTDAGEAAQRTGGGSHLPAPVDALQDVGVAAGIAGAELGDKAIDLAKASDQAFGASEILAHEANRVLHEAGGGRGPMWQVVDRAGEYAKESEQLAAQADNLADTSRTLKTIGKIGDGLTAIEIGVELWELYDNIFKTHEAKQTLEASLYRVYIEKCSTAWDIYKKNKRTETWIKAQLRIFYYELQHSLLWNDYLYSVENHINFWTSVGDIYGAFLPGFGFVGTEAAANFSHRHIWQPIYGD